MNSQWMSRLAAASGARRRARNRGERQLDAVAREVARIDENVVPADAGTCALPTHEPDAFRGDGATVVGGTPGPLFEDGGR